MFKPKIKRGSVEQQKPASFYGSDTLLFSWTLEGSTMIAFMWLTIEVSGVTYFRNYFR